MFDFEGMVKAADGILGKFMPDKTRRMELAQELATLGQSHSHEQTMGQIAINKVEAASKFLFVAGWRPAVGWICALGLLYQCFLYQILDIWFVMPDMNTDLLETTLYGMLGMAAIRGVEKFKGVARGDD